MSARRYFGGLVVLLAGEGLVWCRGYWGIAGGAILGLVYFWAFTLGRKEGEDA